MLPLPPVKYYFFGAPPHCPRHEAQSPPQPEHPPHEPHFPRDERNIRLATYAKAQTISARAPIFMIIPSIGCLLKLPKRLSCKL